MAKAAGEIADKYESGAGGQDTSVDGPTGALYKERQAAEKAEKKLRTERRAALDAASNASAAAKKASGRRGCAEDEDERDEGEEDGDEDNDLRLLRENRLKQIKNSHKEKVENIGKGHGQYRTITQDEFLAEVTSSPVVVCHFFHGDFPRCAIIDHHIQRLVGRHVETKFVKIDASKTPFFVDKVISTLRFLCCCD